MLHDHIHIHTNTWGVLDRSIASTLETFNHSANHTGSKLYNMLRSPILINSIIRIVQPDFF